jgi:hypothetical protein
MRELDAALYTIAWIAPLEIEAQAARHMLDNRHDGKFPISRGDDYVFLAGDINGHNIVIATLPPGQEYGTGSAAALASQIKKFFTNLWFGLLVGVAAGLPNLRKIPPIDIRLGDVLVGLSEGDSAGLVAYDLGKEASEGFQLLRLGQSWQIQRQPSDQLLATSRSGHQVTLMSSSPFTRESKTENTQEGHSQILVRKRISSTTSVMMVLIAPSRGCSGLPTGELAYGMVLSDLERS